MLHLLLMYNASCSKKVCIFDVSGNHMKLSYLLIFGLLSCSYPQNGSKKKTNGETQLSDDVIGNLKDAQADSLFNNPDDRFETFLSKFNADSIFQVSRIVFPLKGEVLDMESDNLELITKKIEKSEFSKFDFTYNIEKANPLIDSYTQDIKVNGNRAEIIFSGIENGINAVYFFEKRGGKWMLVYFQDHST